MRGCGTTTILFFIRVDEFSELLRSKKVKWIFQSPVMKEPSGFRSCWTWLRSSTGYRPRWQELLPSEVLQRRAGLVRQSDFHVPWEMYTGCLSILVWHVSLEVSGLRSPRQEDAWKKEVREIDWIEIKLPERCLGLNLQMRAQSPEVILQIVRCVYM